ncbi:MAG: serine hydrolase domain-containing protein [Mycobacteriaceae bacterium]
MRALKAISAWPVRTAAAVVISSQGVIADHGDQSHIFPLASVTKILVAYAALVAIEEGAIELDEQVGPAGSTVRHLLSHASGLAFNENRIQELPAKKRIYSSSGFEVLAELIETESGIAFPDYLAEAVFTPLRMGATTLVGAAGHGAQSTTADIALFAAELLEPTLISPQTFSEATQVQFPGLNGLLPGYGVQRPNDWGLGFELKSAKNPHWTGTTNSPQTFGHFGQSGTFLWVDPVAKIACAVLTDEPFGDWAKSLWPLLSDAVIAEFV